MMNNILMVIAFLFLIFCVSYPPLFAMLYTVFSIIGLFVVFALVGYIIVSTFTE